jgi:hypothetical protein
MLRERKKIKETNFLVIREELGSWASIFTNFIIELRFRHIFRSGRVND